jgi:hypothetical protein
MEKGGNTPNSGNVPAIVEKTIEKGEGTKIY